MVHLRKQKLVYILSPSFSGSTLLTMLLAQHPMIATMGELKATAMGPIENYKCSCGQLISDCDFWKEILQNSKSSPNGFCIEDFGTHFTSSSYLNKRVLGAQYRDGIFEKLRYKLISCLPNLNREYQLILNQNRWLVDLICKFQGEAQVYIDGSKDPHRLSYLERSGIWDISVIWLHRDGRAQCNSRRQKNIHDVTYEKAVFEWCKTIKQELKVVKLFQPDRVYSVFYEELCKQPTKIINNIFDFLGLEKLNYDWRDIDLSATSHHILGNSMRTKKRIQISLDDRWRVQVSAQESDYFEKHAGRLSKQIGY